MPKTKNPELLERNAQRIYGCSLQDALALNDGRALRERRSPANLYAYQRQAAKSRGKGWEITFPEWLDCWVRSGKWADRGVGAGKYCMARFGDEGPYKIGNVEIALCTKNSADGIKKSRALGCMRHHGKRFLGRGRGWTPVGKKFQVVAAGRYIGTFPTQELAESAYKLACAHARDSLEVV